MPAKLPREIKQQRGTLKKHRDNPLTPNVENSTPVAPKKLAKNQQKYFKAICQLLEQMQVLTLSDIFVVEQLSKALARDDQYDAELRALGTTVYETRTQTGEIKYSAHPQVTQQTDNVRLIIQLLAKVGLTPVDRQNLHALANSPPTKESEEDRILFG